MLLRRDTVLSTFISVGRGNARCETCHFAFLNEQVRYVYIYYNWIVLHVKSSNTSSDCRTVVLIWVVCVFITRKIEEFLPFHNGARANLRVRLQTCGFIWVVCFDNSPSWQYPVELPPSTIHQNRLPIWSACLCRYPLHESINQWMNQLKRSALPHHTTPRRKQI